jgi:hypothetical protein
MAADSTPFSALDSGTEGVSTKAGSWILVVGYFIVTTCSTMMLMLITMWMFSRRWKLTGLG